jgi:hypothetical protein
MKKWPEIEASVKLNKKTDKYKATAKTKVPCGIVFVDSYENAKDSVAYVIARGRCITTSTDHVHKHRCNKKK